MPRPLLVLIRARKPCWRFLVRLEGWYVLFISGRTKFNQIPQSPIGGIRGYPWIEGGVIYGGAALCQRYPVRILVLPHIVGQFRYYSIDMPGW